MIRQLDVLHSRKPELNCNSSLVCESIMMK